MKRNPGKVGAYCLDLLHKYFNDEITREEFRLSVRVMTEGQPDLPLKRGGEHGELH